jgi:hypothetical protein
MVLARLLIAFPLVLFFTSPTRVAGQESGVLEGDHRKLVDQYIYDVGEYSIKSWAASAPQPGAISGMSRSWGEAQWIEFRGTKGPMCFPLIGKGLPRKGAAVFIVDKARRPYLAVLVRENKEPTISVELVELGDRVRCPT